MKRKILALGVTALIATGAYAMEDLKTSIGIGAGAALSPYQGVGAQGAPLPFLDAQWGNFYIRTGDVRYSLISLGYNFWQNDRVVLSAYVNPFGGFDVDRSEMDSGYKNIDNREYQFEGGLKAVLDTGWNGLKLQTHGTFGEEGGHVGASAFRPFQINPKLTIVPRVGATYFESDYVDYYFGVSQSEANRNSKIDKKYSPDGAFSFNADLAANYAYRENINFFGFAGVEKFSSEIDDSPIVEEDVLYRVGAGVKYTF